MKKKIGVIHGKFQVLHLGHMEYLLAGKSKCDFLYIGITNPDPNLTSVNQNNLNRSKISSNPLTYYERLEMIREAMYENKIDRSEFEIVPFPINYPSLIKYYVPSDALYFITIYDEWGWNKYDTLKKLGLEVDIMWVRKVNERFTSGTEVRELIRNNRKWEHLVPKSVAYYLKSNNLINKIKRIK